MMAKAIEMEAVTARATRPWYEKCMGDDADVGPDPESVGLGLTGASETVGRQVAVGAIVSVGRHEELG
jgi:hypothetical protein